MVEFDETRFKSIFKELRGKNEIKLYLMNHQDDINVIPTKVLNAYLQFNQDNNQLELVRTFGRVSVRRKRITPSDRINTIYEKTFKIISVLLTRYNVKLSEETLDTLLDDELSYVQRFNFLYKTTLEDIL
jgi:hypothetical protein